MRSMSNAITHGNIKVERPYYVRHHHVFPARLARGVVDRVDERHDCDVTVM